MEAPNKPDRASAVAAAAAHELNDELTVILSSISNILESVGPEHQATKLLQEVQAAAQRCAWRASTILNFTKRQGTRPAATPLSHLTIL